MNQENVCLVKPPGDGMRYGCIVVEWSVSIHGLGLWALFG